LALSGDIAPPKRPVSPELTTGVSSGGLERPFGSRIPWADLLKRVYDVDALACPCGGWLRFIALIIEGDVAQSILNSLGLDSAPPPIARARSPDFYDAPPADW
jgi:hypothetical protein